jgi:hypothetical protein
LQVDLSLTHGAVQRPAPPSRFASTADPSPAESGGGREGVKLPQWPAPPRSPPRPLPSIPEQSLELRRRAIAPVHPSSCVAATVEVGRPQGLQHAGRRSAHGVRVQSASRGAQFAFCSVVLRGLRAEILLGLPTAYVTPVVGAGVDSSDCPGSLPSGSRGQKMPRPRRPDRRRKPATGPDESWPSSSQAPMTPVMTPAMSHCQ